MLLFIRQGVFWKSDVRIQIADLISGTLAYIYDSHKCSADAPDYLKILHNKIIRVELYSETYKTYTLENSAIADDYDEDIAQLCFAQAVKFVEHNAEYSARDCAPQPLKLSIRSGGIEHPCRRR